MTVLPAEYCIWEGGSVLGWLSGKGCWIVLGTFSVALWGAERPNIVLIVADDLGWADLGCYGQKTLRTPHLDRMAEEGIRFTNFYAGSTVCAPSRCALMTGKHTGHATVRGNRNPEVPLRPDDVTIGEVLKQAGYDTAAFGKWGLGGVMTWGHPNLQGFDYFFGYLNHWHAHAYYPQHLWENSIERMILENLTGFKRVYSHELFVERILQYLEKHTERPFFLYIAFTLPHANNELGKATGDGMEVPGYGSYARMDWPRPERGFAAMIEMLDRDVGRILAKLKELGLDKSTLVLFTSDNGPHSEGGHRAEFFDSNGPLRGIKRDLYEGGIRVPLIARWPGRIRPDQVSDHVWAFWDLLPTLAELVGVPAPEGIDGLSMLGALLGDRSVRQHDFLYWEFFERGFEQAVRMGYWKAIKRAGEGTIELYNLQTDIGEQNNVASEHPEVVKQVEAILRLARRDSPEFPVLPPMAVQRAR